MTSTPSANVSAAEVRAQQAVHEVADLLATDELTRGWFDAIAARIDDTDTQQAFRDGLLDLVLATAERYLVDHALDATEAADLRRLTTLLRVAEGEFASRRRDALGVLLRREMSRLTADGVVDWTETAYLDALQSAFRLGYDEFLDIACGDLTREERTRLRLP
jgi:hypothetical protein